MRGCDWNCACDQRETGIVGFVGFVGFCHPEYCLLDTSSGTRFLLGFLLDRVLYCRCYHNGET